MPSNRFDRFYEEAGRSPASCDILLKRLHRARKLCLISFFGLLLVALAVCLWAFIPLIRFLDSPTVPASPSVDRIVSIPPSLLITIAIPIFIGLAFDFAFLLHNDVCIKMILFMRGHQTRPATPDDNTRNA